MEEMLNDEIAVDKDYEPSKQMLLRHYSPLGKNITPLGYIEYLLKMPGKLIFEINNRPKLTHFITALIFCTIFLRTSKTKLFP